jgi:WhiB family redox-sensing transcriptional regulator
MKKPEMPNALCIGKQELFYINLPYNIAEREKERRAKQLCFACVHISECREWAMAHEDYGIWGGTTEKERAALRRTMNILVVRPEREMIDQMRKTSRKATFAAKGLAAMGESND